MSQLIPSNRHRDLEHVITLLNDVTNLLSDAASQDISVAVRNEIVRASSRVHTSLYLLREIRSGQEGKLSDETTTNHSAAPLETQIE